MATNIGITGDIHSAQHHDSAAKHVSGRAVYVDDIVMPAHGLVVLIGQVHSTDAGMRMRTLADQDH